MFLLKNYLQHQNSFLKQLVNSHKPLYWVYCVTIIQHCMRYTYTHFSICFSKLYCFCAIKLCDWKKCVYVFQKLYWFRAIKLFECQKNTFGEFTQADVSLYWMYCVTIIQHCMHVAVNFHVKIRYIYKHFFSYVFKSCIVFVLSNCVNAKKKKKYIWHTKYTI